MARRIHQLLPAAHAGDATGDSARHLAHGLRTAGYDAGLYALTIDPGLRGQVHPFDSFPEPRDGDLTLLHFALPSVLSSALVRSPGKRGIVYHNLTPPEMLAEYAPEVARLTARGREELQELADSGRVELAVGVSEFNTADLVAAGFARTLTLPLPMDLHRYDVQPDTVLAARLASAPRIFLTVGRVAPNKRLEDFLRMAAYYLAYIDPDAWFVVVGGNRGLERYYDALMQLREELGLDDRVRFVGRVPHRDLVAWYRAASVYVCTSEHEGFCAPLLEAMHFGVPILARSAGAVPETLGDAGLTFRESEPAAVAEALHALATHEPLRRELAARGRARLDLFLPEAVTGRWVSALRETAGAP